MPCRWVNCKIFLINHGSLVSVVICRYLPDWLLNNLGGDERAVVAPASIARGVIKQLRKISLMSKVGELAGNARTKPHPFFQRLDRFRSGEVLKHVQIIRTFFSFYGLRTGSPLFKSNSHSGNVKIF
jgi:hypothetical protein